MGHTGYEVCSSFLLLFVYTISFKHGWLIFTVFDFVKLEGAIKEEEKEVK